MALTKNFFDFLSGGDTNTDLGRVLSGEVFGICDGFMLRIT